MDLHLLKLNKFCRLCKNILGIEEEKKKRNKVSVLEILKLQYPELEDFSFDNEDPNKFPGYICFSCHNKSSKWKADYSKHKNKMSRKPVSSREPFHSNREIVALNSVTSGFVCSRNSDCQVCSLVTVNNLKIHQKLAWQVSSLIFKKVCGDQLENSSSRSQKLLKCTQKLRNLGHIVLISVRRGTKQACSLAGSAKGSLLLQ